MAPNGNHHYDTQDYAGDRAAQTHRTMQHMPSEDRVDRADLQNSITGDQATQLAPEVRMGDDRALGDTPNWDAFDSSQLYDFATRNNSPSTADDLGRAFNTGGNSLADAANGLFDAVTRLDGAWSGVAADSARDALAPLARAAGQAGQTAQMMGVQMSRQSLAATEVRKLPPAQTFDQQQSLNAMLSGGPAAMQADLKAQKDAAEAVKREQISYLATYTKAMSAVDAQTPSFVPPPERRINPGSGGDAKISGSPVAFSGGAGGFGPGGSGGPSSGAFTGADPAAGGGVAGSPSGAGGGSVLPGTATGSAAFTTSGTAPVSGSTAPLGGAPQTAGPGGGSGFGGAFGAFGPGAGGAAAGAGGVGAGQPGEAARGGAVGPRGGVTGMTGQGAAGRGAGGVAAPGGRRQGEDDDEHERPSFLIEGDPEGTFGSDQVAAPSVIGGDDDD